MYCSEYLIFNLCVYFLYTVDILHIHPFIYLIIRQLHNNIFDLAYVVTDRNCLSIAITHGDLLHFSAMISNFLIDTLHTDSINIGKEKMAVECTNRITGCPMTN